MMIVERRAYIDNNMQAPASNARRGIIKLPFWPAYSLGCSDRCHTKNHNLALIRSEYLL